MAGEAVQTCTSIHKRESKHDTNDEDMMPMLLPLSRE